MPPLNSRARARLPDTAFAYIDSAGRRRLPIHDEPHVRNALARFSRVAFESDAARERARRRLLRAAKRYGIVPVGFIDRQLRDERASAEVRVRAREAGRLPTGEITFLLTDIEGSTELVARLGDRYGGLLDGLRRLQRTAISAAGGVEVDARGDEYFAVFRSAPDALRASLEMQRRLAGASWPNGVEVRLRIGLHTGRPTLTATGYIGIAVHAAARICRFAEGGQIVLSVAARRAVGPMTEVEFRGLGTHRLRGLPRAEDLYAAEATSPALSAAVEERRRLSLTARPAPD